jgi:hypothetical protein
VPTGLEGGSPVDLGQTPKVLRLKDAPCVLDLGELLFEPCIGQLG